MTQASNLRPAGVSRRSRRGARSRNRGSIRLVYRSGGSTMWESAEMSLWVIIATLLLDQDGSGREPGVRRAPPRARTLRPRAPVVKAGGECSLIEDARRRRKRRETTGSVPFSQLVLRALQTCRQLRLVVCDRVADLVTRKSPRFGEACLGQVRLGQVGLAEVRAGEIRPGEVGLGEYRVGEDRQEEIRLGEVRRLEVCLGEVRPVEIRLGEVRPGEVRPVEVRLGEVCLGEVRRGEVRSREVRQGKVCPRKAR